MSTGRHPSHKRAIRRHEEAQYAIQRQFRKQWHGHTCEESLGAFWYCGRRAVAAVSWPLRGEGPYIMCEMCAWHNVKNRNATLVASWSGFNLKG